MQSSVVAYDTEQHFEVYLGAEPTFRKGLLEGYMLALRNERYLLAQSVAVLLFCACLGVYKRAGVHCEATVRRVYVAASPMGATLSTVGDANNVPASTFIEEALSNNDVVVFSKTFCPYSSNVKQAVGEAGANVSGFKGALIIELNQRLDSREMLDALYKKTGRKTIPIVFIGGIFIGGMDDVTAMHSNGLLSQAIRVAMAQPSHTELSLKSFLRRGSQSTDRTPEQSTPRQTKEYEIATFAGGCFWGLELAFQREHGVMQTEVGFSNGNFGPVSYSDVITGKTGHAEVVRVWFDSQQTTFQRLIELWESRHNPTSRNRQGNDHGTQYRSGIFYHDDNQQEQALQWRIDAQKKYAAPIVTIIEPVRLYNAAEAVHQKYLQKGGQSALKGEIEPIRCYG